MSRYEHAPSHVSPGLAGAGLGHRSRQAGGPLSAAPSDGWIGTHELPGYRAGGIVAKLTHLPGVDAQHLYLDLVLLGPDGCTQDSLSGPCLALDRDPALDERSHFVRLVAEFLRYAPDAARGLAHLGPVFSLLRQQGLSPHTLAAAAHILDAACSEQAVAESLARMLALSLGEDEAGALLTELVEHLQRTHDPAAPDATLDGDDLVASATRVVRTVGKTRARNYLRARTGFGLLPSAEMFGL